MAAPPKCVETAWEQLLPQFGERLSRNLDVRQVHGRGEGFHVTQPPDLVVFPTTAREVSDVVRLASRLQLPVIVYGAGTSLEGGVAAPAGGISIDMSSMNSIISVKAEDLDCTVEAGVTREQLNRELRDLGLFFPIDPGANATLGGMAATRASGTTAVRYGTMRNNVLSLQVVFADGAIARTARRARKSAAGYDMTGMFVGSEGTLGIITEVTLRLYGRPEAEAVAVCPFPALDGAINSVIQTMQYGIPVARIELLDAMQIRACNLYHKAAMREVPTLFLEFHGSPASIAEHLALVTEIASENGGGPLEHAQETEARSHLWRMRHDAYHAAKALQPGAELLVTDVCVPISRLAECIAATHDDIAGAGLLAPIVGHVGDGNFHVLFSVQPGDDAAFARVRRLNDRLVARAIALDGTCTGEHGIGLGKREKLVDELGAPLVQRMAAIKRALDPGGILNPGKIFLPDT